MSPRVNTVILYISFLSIGQIAQAQTPKLISIPIKHSNIDDAGPFIPLVSMGVGTPPQLITAILDTGSSDLVIPRTGSRICQDKQQQCSGTPFVTGSFDTDRDTSIADVNTKLNTSFANGAVFQGGFVKTTLTLGNQSVSDSQLGVIEQGSLPSGNPLFPIFGIGPIENEVVQPPYQNTLANLKDTGAINANVYGIFMNDFRKLSIANVRMNARLISVSS